MGDVALAREEVVCEGEDEEDEEGEFVDGAGVGEGFEEEGGGFEEETGGEAGEE